MTGHARLVLVVVFGAASLLHAQKPGGGAPSGGGSMGGGGGGGHVSAPSGGGQPSFSGGGGQPSFGGGAPQIRSGGSAPSAPGYSGGGNGGGNPGVFGGQRSSGAAPLRSFPSGSSGYGPPPSTSGGFSGGRSSPSGAPGSTGARPGASGWSTTPPASGGSASKAPLRPSTPYNYEHRGWDLAHPGPRLAGPEPAGAPARGSAAPSASAGGFAGGSAGAATASGSTAGHTSHGFGAPGTLRPTGGGAPAGGASLKGSPSTGAQPVKAGGGSLVPSGGSNRLGTGAAGGSPALSGVGSASAIAGSPGKQNFWSGSLYFNSAGNFGLGVGYASAANHAFLQGNFGGYAGYGGFYGGHPYHGYGCGYPSWYGGACWSPYFNPCYSYWGYAWPTAGFYYGSSWGWRFGVGFGYAYSPALYDDSWYPYHRAYRYYPYSYYSTVAYYPGYATIYHTSGSPVEYAEVSDPYVEFVDEVPSKDGAALKVETPAEMDEAATDSRPVAPVRRVASGVPVMTGRALPAALTTPFIGSFPADLTSAQYLAQARQDLTLGRFIAAAEGNRRALETGATQASPAASMGVALFAAGLYQSASISLNEAFDRDPALAEHVENPVAQFGSPAAFQTARLELERHVVAHPADGSARFVLGYMYFGAGDYFAARGEWAVLAAGGGSDNPYVRKMLTESDRRFLAGKPAR